MNLLTPQPDHFFFGCLCTLYTGKKINRDMANSQGLYIKD